MPRPRKSPADLARRPGEAAEKRCTECGDVKPIDQFHIRPSVKAPARYYACLTCHRERSKTYSHRYKLKTMTDAKLLARLKSLRRRENLVEREMERRREETKRGDAEG